MRIPFMARCLLCSVFLSLFVSFAASAELESYGFPNFDAQRKPHFTIKPVFAKTPQISSSQEKNREKHRKAQCKSIANLLQRYNRNLNDQAALKYAGYILQACERFDQDPFVVAAMIVNESSARHDAVSKGGDYGLMQVRWRVHRKSIVKKYPHIKDAKGILDPEYNVLVGTEILARYCVAANNLRDGLMRYSAGNKKLADKVFAALKGLQNSYKEHLSAL